MKKNICLLIIILLLPFYVKALDIETSINCDNNNLAVNGMTNCTIKATTNGQVSALSMKLSASDSLLLSDLVTDSSWQGNGENGEIALYTDVNKTGTFNIATFKLKLVQKNAGVVSLNNIMYSDNNFVEFKKDSISKNINVLSDVNILSSLKINGNVVEGFSSNKNDYVIQVDSSLSSVNIEAVKSDTSSKVTGDVGTKNINYGENKFNIVVISETGVTNTYHLQINRLEVRYLKSLKINGTGIALKKGTYQYSFQVEDEVTSVIIESEIENTNLASYVSGYGNRTIDNLKEGNNEVQIQVKDKDDKILTYKITINRKNEQGETPTQDNPDTPEPTEDPTETQKVEDETEQPKSEEQSVKNPKTGNFITVGLVVMVVVLAVLCMILANKCNKLSKID